MGNFTSQDSLVCPRCAEKFHDVDIEENPDKYWTCPYCHTIEHTFCRGPVNTKLSLETLPKLKQDIVKWAVEVFWNGYEMGQEESEIFELDSDLMCELSEILEKYGLDEEGRR